MDIKCLHCGSWTDFSVDDFPCPDCQTKALTIPLGEELGKINRVLDAQHELTQAMAKSMLKFNEDLKKLEERLFPDQIPTIKRGKWTN